MSNVAGKAYGMNVLTPMKPWRTWLNTLIFLLARNLPSALSGLLGLSLIHFARWVMIRRTQWPDLGQGPQHVGNDYMLFCSNFNGTWDQYIDAFSDGIPNGLDLFWYSSTKYPQSIPITGFKDYILHNQIDTNYYYNATPGSAQRDVKSALKVYGVLLTLATRHAAATPDGFAAIYRAALVDVQNCLGAPGYAPVASIDTDEADWNRAPFVEAGKALATAPANSTGTRSNKPSRTGTSASFDGGHYFLTVLAPVQNTHTVEYQGVACSAVQRLRAVLSTLPTALQSRATEAIGLNSPFSRNTRTHFARFVIINDVPYNGRESDDALAVALSFGRIRPVTPQAQDRLRCPYLLFSAELDAADGNVETLQGYLAELWSTMQPELRAVFENCVGFDTVRTPEEFCDYILACEIETTMPFNDYWVGPPQLPSRLLGALAPGALLVLAAIALILASIGAAVFGYKLPVGIPLAILLGVFGVLLGGYLAYRGVMASGRRPLPSAPHSDLPSVLKAIYLQQQFTRHVIATQGMTADDGYRAFGDFINRHRPTELHQPTQMPGVIATSAS